MTLNRQIVTAALCATGITGGLQAQQTVAGVAGLAGGPDKNVSFQYFFNNAEAGMNAVRVEAMPTQAVTGKPFSATEVRRTRQTLGDGTHIDKVEKDKFYRDFDGRTRIERENGGSVSISDPTKGAMRESTNGKSRVVMMRSGTFTAAVPAERAQQVHDRLIVQDKINTITSDLDEKRVLLDAGNAAPFQPNAVAGVPVSDATFARTMIARTMPDKGVTEDLGDQVINGVVARGTRSTITIPEGQIGNDREIKVVSERWFSNDLGVLIKSTNNDPRFGETTFELTDILQGAQDPTLFELPAVKH